MSQDFEVLGTNGAAPFTLKVHRGEGMALLGMNWKNGKPPNDFVGFAIEYQEPGGDKFYALKNRLSFPGFGEKVNPNILSTRLSPIQKFRWVHFPRNAELKGNFIYRVTPVFMNSKDELSYGDFQEVAIALQRETHQGKLNVSFTRGFVSSQAFVDKYGGKSAIAKLLPKKAADGLTFKPTHPKTQEALEWMGFEARKVILELLDQAIADPNAQVRVVAYDLNEPEIVTRLEKLGARVKVIIDDSADHGEKKSGETQAFQRLVNSAGKANVKRQHMGQLQHNKTIAVSGAQVQAVVCGSTNYSWRGFYVQANNALVMHGQQPLQRFQAAFNDYWANDNAAGFGASASAKLIQVQMTGVDVSVGFSPYASANLMLTKIGQDMEQGTTSSLFYSLAFLSQTSGAVRTAVKKVTKQPGIFVYGMADRKVGGIELQKPDGNIAPVRPEALEKDVPEPFKSEPTGGGGTRMHHKFVVIDFDKPTGRVYLGSYNFSPTADGKNGENLILIRDRRVAVAYVVEAIRLFDHYHFRVAQAEAKKNKKRKKLMLAKPPRKAGEKPWWDEDWTNARKVRDRELFA